MYKIFFYIFFLQSLFFSQIVDNPDSIITLIKNSDPDIKAEWENELIFYIYNADYEPAKALSDKLLEFAPTLKNKSLYISTLIHSSKFYPFEQKIVLINEAQFIAESGKYDYLIPAVYNFKAIAFRDNSMTDSAMIYILKSKDIVEHWENILELIIVYEFIASMHFYAGQYEEAEKLYKLIQNTEPNHKQSWRYVVNNNNLALIKMEQKKYEEAEKLFNISLQHITSKNMNFADSSALPYLYRKLLEVSLYQNKFELAEKYFDLGEFFSIRFGQTSELPGIYVAKGNLCYEKKDYDSALYFFNKAYELNKSYYDIRNELNIYDGFAKTYTALNDIKNANKYLKLSLEVDNKADSIFYRARYMNIFAEHNYNNYKKEIETHKREKSFLQIIISVIFISLVSISIYYVKLRRSNKFLVRKNIEIAEIETNILPVHHSILKENKIDINKSEVNITDENDTEKHNDLINKLEELILNEKIYLIPEITINEVADKLKTNRTYLSKAINSIFKVSFNNYINELRIKEAVKILSHSEYKNLSIEGIAQKSGFNNRVSFTQAFQKYTGVSPSFFMKNLDSEV